MSCKDENKSNQNNSFNVSSLSNIIKLLIVAFNAGKTPSIPLPPQLVAFGSPLKTGLSAKDIAARIMSRRHEAGLKNNLTFGDGPNSDLIMHTIVAEEIVLAIHTTASVQGMLSPNVPIQATGIGNLGIPVPVIGSTSAAGIIVGSIV